MLQDSARKLLLIITAALLVPAAVGASPRAPSRSTPDSGSNISLSTSKATFLLQQIQADAFQVRNEADQLESFNLNEEMDWRTHADLWETMRDQINDMSLMLHQLEINKASLQPWEKRAVDRIAPAIFEMANNTEIAIHFLNNNQNHLFTPTYASYPVEVRVEAHRVELSLKNFAQYAQAKHELNLLSKRLDLKGKS
jgi:hypothetical protein